MWSQPEPLELISPSRKAQKLQCQGNKNMVQASSQESCQGLSSCFCLPQVDPGGTLQVQVQPARGEARQRWEVVDPEEDWALLPPCQPAGPEEVLRGQELALSRAGLREKASQDKRDQLGRGRTGSSLVNTSCLSLFYPYPCSHLFSRGFPASLPTCFVSCFFSPQ